MSTSTGEDRESEVAFLARMLGDEGEDLPAGVAHYLLDLDLKLGERDRTRMHDLASRNQADELTSAEREEMLAYGKATTWLSILKSKARRSLGVTHGRA